MGLILKCSPMSENTMHLRSCTKQQNVRRPSESLFDNKNINFYSFPSYVSSFKFLLQILQTNFRITKIILFENFEMRKTCFLPYIVTSKSFIHTIYKTNQECSLFINEYKYMHKNWSSYISVKPNKSLLQSLTIGLSYAFCGHTNKLL